MKPRPSLVVCLVLALLGWCLAGDVSGPEPRAATSNTAPVQMGGVSYPSPDASPVAQGKVDRLTTDGRGILWTRNPRVAMSTWKTVSVDTTATGTELLAANTARKLLIVVNNGSTAVYLGFGSVASGAAANATGGMLLAASGGSLTLDGPMATSQIKAITAASSSIVFVAEGE